MDMDKDFWKALFSIPSLGDMIVLFLGLFLLILPDSLAALGVSMRNWVENTVLFIGGFMVLGSFMDIWVGPMIEAVVTSWRSGKEAQKMKNDPTVAPPSNIAE